MMKTDKEKMQAAITHGALILEGLWFRAEKTEFLKTWEDMLRALLAAKYPNGNPMFAMLDEEQPLTIVTSNGKTGCWRLTLKEEKE